MYTMDLFWYNLTTKDYSEDASFYFSDFCEELDCEENELKNVINNIIEMDENHTLLNSYNEVAVFMVYKDGEDFRKYAVTDDESKIDDFLRNDVYDVILVDRD